MKFKIGNKLLNEKNKAYIIAEIGVNHNGKLQIAKKLIDQALLSGADCVKFQTFNAENVATKKTKLAAYQKKNKVNENNQFDMLKKLELSKKDFVEIFKYCKKKKIDFLSTPVNKEDVDFLDKIGVKAFKMASMHASEPEFIKHVISKNKPIFASTGMCDINEVKEMVKILKKSKNKNICLMQCTSNYPSKIEDSHINVLKRYKKFGLLIGYSDHTSDDVSAIVALALGAKVFEKHFTLNKKMIGPDHKASLNPKQLKRYINNIRLAEKSLGSEIKQTQKSELSTKLLARRSLTVSKKIYKGEKITSDKIKFMRPGTGIKAKDLRLVINKKAKRDLNTNDFLNWKHIVK
tara:strand:+ start:705 stop:1751 length:1047 start_codon:yes stop_codon:yes gene_type:complete